MAFSAATTVERGIEDHRAQRRSAVTRFQRFGVDSNRVGSRRLFPEMMDQPLLSIVVPCRNPGPRLRTALESIWGQSDFAPELLVIDGGSTDGTREWLGVQRARISTFVSEPDRGVYDAMNRGIAMARGRWILFLGADDRLADPGVLKAVEAHLRTAAGGVVAGESQYDDGRIYRFRANANPIARNFVHHQCAFYERNLFEQHGGYDLGLPITADYEMNVRLWLAGVPFTAMPVRVAQCGIGGISDGGRWRVYREEFTVRHRYFPTWRCWLWDVASIVRYLRKQIVRASARH